MVNGNTTPFTIQHLPFNINTLSPFKDGAEHAAQEVAAHSGLRLRLGLATAEHATEYTAEQVAEATLALLLLSAAHEDAGDAAEVETALVAGLAEHTHHNGGEDGHKFHHLPEVEARGLADLLCGRFLLVAEDVPQDAQTIGSPLALALHHTAHHAHQVVEHAAIVILVEGRAEGRQTVFGAGIVGQATQKGAKNTTGCGRGLFFFRADMLADVVEYVVRKLTLEYL